MHSISVDSLFTHIRFNYQRSINKFKRAYTKWLQFFLHNNYIANHALSHNITIDILVHPLLDGYALILYHHHHHNNDI